MQALQPYFGVEKWLKVKVMPFVSHVVQKKIKVPV